MHKTIKKCIFTYVFFQLGLNFYRLWRRYSYIKQLKNNNNLDLKLQSCQSKGLVYLKEHYIYGDCVPDKQIIKIKESSHHFMMIEQIKTIYQGSSTTNKKTQLWVNSFKLNSKQLNSTIIDLTQFKPLIHNNLYVQFQGHSKKKNKESHKSFLQIVGKFLKNFGRRVQVINQGVMFNTKMAIVGDFLYNPDTKLLRCYKPISIGNQGDLNTYILEQKIINVLLFIINVGLAYGLYLFNKNILQKEEQQLQKYSYQLDKAIVLTDMSNFKCSKCKINNHNIVFTPCFHFILCDSCAQDVIKCQVCQQHITKKVKIYMG